MQASKGKIHKGHKVVILAEDPTAEEKLEGEPRTTSHVLICQSTPTVLPEGVRVIGQYLDSARYQPEGTEYTLFFPHARVIMVESRVWEG